MKALVRDFKNDQWMAVDEESVENIDTVHEAMAELLNEIIEENG